MLQGTGRELNLLYAQLSKFLASGAEEVSFPADFKLDPAPYKEFLQGLRVKKAQGLTALRLADDRWLELAGSVVNLAAYVRHFRFDDPDAHEHHHPDNGSHMARGSLCLIVQADSSWDDDAG